MTATVTSKGQVTIPKAIREQLGIMPGTKVDFSIDDVGRAILEPEKAAGREPSRFERMCGTATIGMTTDEIMALLRGEPD